MLSASENRLQLLAIQLLGDVQNKKCAPLLLKQLNKPLGGSAKIKERLRTKEQQASDPDPRFCLKSYKKKSHYKISFWQRPYLLLESSNPKNPYLICSKGLEQKDSRIYSFSISGLGHLKATEALEPLCAIVSDRAGRYKEQAIQTLAKIGDEKAIPFLRNVVKEVQKEREYRPDAPSSLASYAIQALAQLGDVEVINMMLTSWEDELESAILALGDASIPLLSDALSSSQSNKIRLFSAEASGITWRKRCDGYTDWRTARQR